MRRRPPHGIDLLADEIAILERLIRDGRTEQRVARRARILLGMGDPTTRVATLASQLEVARTTIWDLCRRFEQRGLVVLFDASRSGRPREFSPPDPRGDRAPGLL